MTSLAIAALVAPVLGCSDGTGPGSDDPPTDTTPGLPDELGVEVVASGLENPLYLTAPPGDPRLFVVEQPGRIRVIEDGELLETPFLDITDRVLSGGERGLLSVAFHPQYESNGDFYVNYTDTNGDTRVERYGVTGDPNVASPDAEALILMVEQPFGNHNGGLVAFGPDGMLYIGMGDGGSGGDPQGHAQNPGTLLGALLRIDVDAGDPYGIPADNPFVGVDDAEDEIWATGLRNPWRFAFDPTDGTLYIADVGQNMWEEVNAEPADAPGLNYGWNVMEGGHCFEPPSGCNMDPFVLPVLEYSHDEGGCSITGGYVYRGDAIPDLQGHYFYSDFCAGFLRSFRLDGGAATEEREWDVADLGRVLSFGEDSAAELYVLSASGEVYRLVEVLEGEALNEG